jgi:hypothetical protein
MYKTAALSADNQIQTNRNRIDMDTLKLLYEYFPMAVNTGKSLIFISEDWRVELKEQKNTCYSGTEKNTPVIRVRVFKKTLNGDFIPGHYEDFKLDVIGDLANQIERYIQFAVGQNLRENV